jgi:hypothetical protein
MRKTNATTFAVSIGMLCCIFFSMNSTAQSPLTKFAKFRRVEADPNKTYHLTQSHGPWMILAGAFAGDGAEQEANALVLELRKRYKLDAFIHQKDYDYTGTVTGIGLDRYGEPKQMRYQKPAAFNEYAVLVGNFTTHDDPNALKVLKALKYSQPSSLNFDKKTNSTLRFAGLRHFHKKMSGNEEKRNKGPLGSAFVTRNPLLPKEYFAPTGIDQMVANMNSGVKYGLLKCPGKFTVQVATFRGRVLLDQNKIQEEVQRGNSVSGRLAAAAEQAHQLTELLRKRGVEAYEFHDRSESIVTVGSFNSVGDPRSDGKTEINPAVLKIMKSYGAQQKPLPGRGPQMNGLVPRQLNGITFDVQPKPVEVPRRSVATDYARRSNSLGWN